MSKIISRITNGLFFVIVLLFMFVNIDLLLRSFGGWFLYYIRLVLFLLVILCFFYSGNSILKKIKDWLSFLDSLSAVKLAIILFAFICVPRILAAILMNVQLVDAGDMPGYWNMAKDIADTGTINEYASYAMMYQYAAAFAFFLSPVVKVFGNDYIVAVSFMTFLYAVITVLLFDIIREYVGNKVSFAGLFVFSFFPVGFFVSMAIIHETAMLFFYALSFWLYNKAYQRKSSKGKGITIVYIILSAIMISIGAVINKGGLVVIISLVLLSICLQFVDGISLRKVGKVLIIVLCYLLCYLVVSNLILNYVTSHVKFQSLEEKERTERIIDNSLFLGWGIYLGANTEERGEFNELDSQTYKLYYEMDNHDEAINYQKGLVNERINKLIDNHLSIVEQLYHKFRKLYSYPFITITWLIDTKLIDRVGIPAKVLSAIANVYNVFISAIILFSIRKRKSKEVNQLNAPELQFKLFIVGLTLSLILFEVMPKYVSHLQIIFTCIAILNIRSFANNSLMFRQKVNKRSIN